MIVYSHTYSFDGNVLRGKAYATSSGAQNLGLPSAGLSRAVRLRDDELGDFAWHISDLGAALYRDLDLDARRLALELRQLVFPCFDSPATDPLHVRRMR
jgi:hypothetical protein